jgi:hypothetical protein
MTRIKYFSYYGCQDPGRRRYNSPAADTKIDYIIEVLNRIGYDVDLISPASASTANFQTGFVEHRKRNSFRYFSSLRKGGRLLRAVNYRFINLQFFLWCLFNIKHGEQILVYHSLGYDSLFIKLKKLKSIRIIGEIEEIYQDVFRQKFSQERDEYRFIEICDKYVFPNTILNEQLNIAAKPYLVCHGIYKVSEHKPVSFNDGKIHVLYAGTYDPNKGGAVASVRAAQFLDERYHVHITGFGRKEHEVIVCAEIERVRPLTKCQISFHGYLDDAEFLNLMRRCSIGLCTQDPTSQLNLTSFPSKILNYMANGLIVISGRNRAIEESEVGNLICYYKEQTPVCIAETIMTIRNINCEEIYDRLKVLDSHFLENLRLIIR